MTSKILIPKISKANKMAENTLRGLVNKKSYKAVTINNESIKISKLSVSQVLEIQEAATNTVTDSLAGLALLKRVIRMSAEGGSDITDEEFSSMPMDDLSKLSNEIMKFSGFGGEAGK